MNLPWVLKVVLEPAILLLNLFIYFRPDGLVRQKYTGIKIVPIQPQILLENKNINEVVVVKIKYVLVSLD